MSVIISTDAQIAGSPTNTSRSKQRFSFPKSPRFGAPAGRNPCDAFYNLPSTRSRRGTSFGYGGRGDLAQRNCSPPPTAYSMRSEFAKGGRKANVFTFGIAREAYAKVYLKTSPPTDPALPGPGTYELKSPAGRDALKYTMRPKTSNPCIP